ncbi:MAG: Gfo/Idh/MocA family oxidoreductase [Verrucomicrobiales bacterium]|nr:Gfo/Idh/MocA family oxidoreductase [Verrucomicrobiales bacterium]
MHQPRGESQASGRRDPVRIGVVGLGQFGRLHTATVAGVAEAELTLMVDPNAAARAAAQAAHPGVSVVADLATALQDDTVEAWIVASSTASHVPLAQQILQAGRPVLVEKPLAEDLAAAEQLAPQVAADSRNFMMGHVALFNTEFRALAEECRRRRGIRFMNLVRHRPVGTAQAFPGENPFHLTMVHDLYLVAALMEGEEPVELRARAGFRTGEVCDLALAELRWADGAWAALTASFLTPDSMGADGFDRIEVFGADWAARASVNPRPLQVWDATTTQHPLTLEISTAAGAPVGMLAEQLRAFCRMVRGAEPPPSGARYADALRVQRWLKELCHAAGL